MCSLQNVVRMVKLRSLQWTAHTDWMGKQEMILQGHLVENGHMEH